MKFIKLSMIIMALTAFVACQNAEKGENSDADLQDTEMQDADMHNSDSQETDMSHTTEEPSSELPEISGETQQISADIGIPINGEKDMDGDGVSDVKLTYEGELVVLNQDPDGGGKTYRLKFDEKDQKWEIDTENEVEQAVESIFEGDKE